MKQVRLETAKDGVVKLAVFALASHPDAIKPTTSEFLKVNEAYYNSTLVR